MCRKTLSHTSRWFHQKEPSQNRTGTGGTPPSKPGNVTAGDISHKKAIYQSEFSKLRFAEAILTLSGEARTATFHNIEERTVKKWK